MFGFIGDLVQVAVSPVRVASSLAREVTKPLADAAKQIADSFDDEDEKDKRK